MFKKIAAIFGLTGFLTMPVTTTAQDDWANLAKYKDQNEVIKQSDNSGKRVIFMGNSITEFWSVTDRTFFDDNNYINRGISGQTTPQMLIRFRPDVIALNPAVVVILAGINDIARNTGPATVEEIAGNIISMAELAKANNITPVLCSVLPAREFYWRPEIEPVLQIIQLNEMLKLYAEKHNLQYVDYYTPMVNEEKGLKKEYGDDGVHPNLMGYKVMEPLVQKAISKVLNVKD